MKKYLLQSFTLLLVLILGTLSGESANQSKNLRKAHTIAVTYKSSFKGNVSPTETLMLVSGDKASVETVTATQDARDFKAPVLKTFIDYQNCKYYRRAELPDGDIISTVNSFKVDSGMTLVRSEKFFGYECSVMRASINSNTIEIWYTTALPFRGTPQPNVGVPDGLVLKVVRNGDAVQEVSSISPRKESIEIFPTSWGQEVEPYVFQYKLNHCNVITVPVFDQQRVNFDGAKLPDALSANEIYNCGGGTIILKKVRLPKKIDDRNVFVEVVQYSDGDAYDRTGSIFMIPTDKKQSFIDAIRDLKSVPSFHSGDTDYHGLVSTTDYDVPLELMRFFTGFGVRAYNHNKVPGQEWVDSVLYKTEVTDIADKLVDEAWIGAYIGNWDRNGHKLSLNLKYYPGGNERTYKTMPLFNTVNYLEQAGQPYPIFMLNDSLKVNFTLDHPVKDAILYYTTTGHGGWGNGDEFNRKPNTIYLDGEKVITFIPWRDDCGTYRDWNPCSGNFSNGLSSSDLSRSNWCPATVTNPDYIMLGDLDAGQHSITVKIPQGAPEGGSNSYWCISGTLLY